MSRRFIGKVALITGGASGIGRTTAIAFATEGASVVVADRDIKEAAETAKLINATGGKAIAVQVDVSKSAEVAAMLEATIKTYSRLDIAVNNAGIGGVSKPLPDYPEDVWRKVLDVNLTGVWLCMKEEIPHILKQGGAIVNVSSLAGLNGFPGFGAYAAAKHGVIGITRTAALEYAKAGLRVNAICPAFTETPMIDDLKMASAKLGERLPRIMPIGRLATTEEIAGTILFLASENASYINGIAMPIDGGASAG